MQATDLTASPAPQRKVPYYLQPATNVCSIGIVRIKPGDKTQLTALRQEWNYWLQVKEEFTTAITLEGMRPAQRAEAEIKLAMITGMIKGVDAQINYLIFGISAIEELTARPIEFYMRQQVRQLKREANRENDSLKARIYVLYDQNYSIKQRNYKLVEKLRQNNLLPPKEKKQLAYQNPSNS